LPQGWTGKLWAVKQGISVAEQKFRPDYLLLSDADIVHAPDTVSWLVAKASSGGYVLTSFMAKLRCVSLAERSQVPAFIYFFQMLFPFTWVRQPTSKTAAAAGGCVLLKAGALRDAGGIDSIRNALIDDCALARQMKRIGPIWLGLTDRARSIRPYEGFAEIKRMVSRSAYAQLGYSPLLLIGTMGGLALTFIAPPLLAVFARGMPQLIGLAAWAAMAVSMLPTLRFYRVSPLWGITLPGIAFLYAYYTLYSAYRHFRRRGGEWKGRVHVNAPSLQ
jgi:hopene-associated glycosyltransferase HpnB